MNIEIISGSPRNESITFKLALYLQAQFLTRTTHNLHVIDVREWNFPTLQQEVFSSVENTPEPYKPLSEHMFAADAFVIVTPEYNGSYTSAMKNIFDHYPKQLHKPFGIVTASTGALGGIRASQQLQLLILALFGIPSPYMLITPQVDKKFNDNGELTDALFEHAVNTFIHEFIWLAERLKP